MLKAPVPSNEVKRLNELLAYNILDTEEEEDYNQLTELAAMFCECEIATISFIDETRQWFKASKNIAMKESPRESSFCGHAIMESEVMVINDASGDERFFDNPFVTGEIKIRFYAGAPIISSSGHALGTVCVIDHTPKKSFDEKHLNALKIIASQVQILLELRIKNNLIKLQAQEIVKAEKSLAKLNTMLREKQNGYIAYELHENIAQLVVAAKMTLETLEDKTDEPSKQAAERLRNYLSIILSDVRSLSNSITPTTFTAADYTGYISNLVESTAAEKNIKIRFLVKDDTLKLKGSLGLNIYRIIQNMLNYSVLGEGNIISIELSGKKKIKLCFQQNGKKDVLWSDDAKLFINDIITRADIINAQFVSDRMHNKMELVFKPEI